MPRHRMRRRGSGSSGAGDQFAWGTLFTKTKMCKFNDSSPCSRGQACSFAHDPEELNALPDFRLTKMCQSIRLFGACKKAEGCNFAHSDEELRASPSELEQLVAPEVEDSCLEGQGSGDLEGLPDCITSLSVEKLDLTLKLPPDPAQESKSAESQLAQTIMAGEDIFSRQTTAQATSNSFSRQTTSQGEDWKDTWSYQALPRLEFRTICASEMQEFPLGAGTIEDFDKVHGRRSFGSCSDDASSDLHDGQSPVRNLAEGLDRGIINSRSDDAPLQPWDWDDNLELKVQNTFLAALPRVRPIRRSRSLASLPTCDRSCAEPLQWSKLFSK
mmetsp:Transcript_36663/g.80357  ORF Transcript_36663/g.80357 Transcript_36663/m.80357 type:complete len:329 (-) Transcript_36663:7-993(-)